MKVRVVLELDVDEAQFRYWHPLAVERDGGVAEAVRAYVSDAVKVTEAAKRGYLSAATDTEQARGDDGDSYDTCAYCGWAGKLRKDGTMRTHRERADSGRVGVTGSLPQDPNGPVCKGSGMEPWKVGLPEGYEVPPTNEHGGFDRNPATTVSEPVWQAAGFGDFAVGDRIRFQTIDNGFGGSGDFVYRTGTVTAVTARTLRVQCDPNWFGDRAMLRRADWHARDPQKAV